MSGLQWEAAECVYFTVTAVGSKVGNALLQDAHPNMQVPFVLLQEATASHTCLFIEAWDVACWRLCMCCITY